MESLKSAIKCSQLAVFCGPSGAGKSSLLNYFLPNVSIPIGDLSGKLVVTGGLGGMGGAQPLAATMNGGTFLAAEIDPNRIEKRLETKYCDEMTSDIDDAIDKAIEWKNAKEGKSIAVVANIVDLLERLIERKVVPDILTDQTSAHDPLIGYIPQELSLEEAEELRENNPQEYLKKSYASMAKHVKLMLKLKDMGANTFDYGNNLRAMAKEAGVKNAFDFPGFVPAYVRPLFCVGKGPFRWAALSGDENDIAEVELEDDNDDVILPDVDDDDDVDVVEDEPLISDEDPNEELIDNN